MFGRATITFGIGRHF